MCSYAHIKIHLLHVVYSARALLKINFTEWTLCLNTTITIAMVAIVITTSITSQIACTRHGFKNNIVPMHHACSTVMFQITSDYSANITVLLMLQCFLFSHL